MEKKSNTRLTCLTEYLHYTGKNIEGTLVRRKLRNNHAVLMKKGSGAAMTELNASVWAQLAELASVYDDQVSQDRTIEYLENSLRNVPRNASVLWALGSRHEERGEDQTALEFFQRSLEVNPRFYTAWRDMGKVYLKLRNLPKAWSSLQAAVKNKGGDEYDAKLTHSLGELHQRFGLYSSARDAFSSLFFCKEASSAVRFEGGCKCIEMEILMGNLESASKLLEVVSHWYQGRSLRLRFLKASLEEAQGKTAEAARCYQELAALGNTEALRQLGKLHCQGKGNLPVDHRLAEQYFERAIELDDKDPDSFYLCGRCRSTKGKMRAALESYAKALSISPYDSSFWCSVGVAFLNLNQRSAALKAFSTGVRSNPTACECWYNIGSLYMAAGMPRDALLGFHKALQWDSENKEIQQRIASVTKLISDNHDDDIFSTCDLPHFDDMMVIPMMTPEGVEECAREVHSASGPQEDTGEAMDVSDQ